MPVKEEPLHSRSTNHINFLLKEYETLRTFRQDLNTLGDRRFNFFVSILFGAAIFYLGYLVNRR
jgi:hypothetical protein